MPPSFACLQVIRVLNGFVIQIYWHTGVAALRICHNLFHRKAQHREMRNGQHITVVVLFWLSFHWRNSFQRQFSMEQAIHSSSENISPNP